MRVCLSCRRLRSEKVSIRSRGIAEWEKETAVGNERGGEVFRARRWSGWEARKTALRSGLAAVKRGTMAACSDNGRFCRPWLGVKEGRPFREGGQ